MQPPSKHPVVRSLLVCPALQVAGETEVKAQIKLRFRTATSQPVVIIRTFQVMPCCSGRLSPPLQLAVGAEPLSDLHCRPASLA